MATEKLISIGIMASSFFVGTLVFYWISSLDKEERKKQLGEVLNFLFNFMIFLWISKIIINFPVFITDPLAILAYPSNSSSFYLAVVISGVFIYIRMVKQNLQVTQFVKALIQVVLTSALLFETIYYVQDRNEYSLSNMIVFGLLLGIYYVAEKFNDLQLFTILLFSWTIGAIILFVTQPYLSFFGYLLSLQFIVVFILVNLGVFVLSKLKR